MQFKATVYNESNKSLTTVIENSVYTVDSNNPNFEMLLESVKDQDADLFIKLYNQEIRQEEVKVQEYLVNSGIEVLDGKVMYNGKEVHHSYAGRILRAQQDGFPITPMVNFFENLLQNPSSRSLEELPDFLLNKNLPLTEDGCFLAYKSVQSDWYSKASGDLTLVQGKTVDGRIYNGVGEVIECQRNQVDDERAHECSKGLHVGGLAYSGPGGWYNSRNDKVVIVKVNPKDVVSVPRDHNAQKVRVCKYEVLSVFERVLNDSVEGVKADKKVETSVVLPKDLRSLDKITFDYMGKNDTYEQTRYLLVEEVDDESVFGKLLYADPSYEEGNESRLFKFENIDGDIIRLPYDWQEDEDYDDEDDDWGM
jgi:hypothetical protein